MDNSYEERVLLKLRRKYSKDEAVSLITQELTKTKIELGELKSYIAELEYKIESFKKTHVPACLNCSKTEDKYRSLLGQVKSQERYSKKYRSLQNEFFELKVKYDNLILQSK